MQVGEFQTGTALTRLNSSASRQFQAVPKIGNRECRNRPEEAIAGNLKKAEHTVRHKRTEIKRIEVEGK